MIMFSEKVYSRYSSNVSFRSLDQERVLTSTIDDYDHMHEVEDSLLENPLYRIFPENPLQMGYYLDSTTTGKPRLKLVNTFIVFKMLDTGGK